jgi:hypothetical protein
MAIEIHYLDGGKGIEIIATGIVTGAEIIEAQKTIYNETNLKKQRYQIIDRTNCQEYSVSSDEVQRIAELDNRAAAINPKIFIAVISPTKLQYGITRMWQSYLEDSCFTTEIFPDRQNADQWIKERLETT